MPRSSSIKLRLNNHTVKFKKFTQNLLTYLDIIKILRIISDVPIYRVHHSENTIEYGKFSYIISEKYVFSHEMTKSRFSVMILEKNHHLI